MIKEQLSVYNNVDLISVSFINLFYKTDTSVVNRDRISNIH